MLGVVVQETKTPRYSAKGFTLENSTEAPDGERARARFCVHVSYAVPPRLRRSAHMTSRSRTLLGSWLTLRDIPLEFLSRWVFSGNSRPLPALRLSGT